MKTHHFSSNTEAYNASQCDADISDGDILVTPYAVAVLNRAWPVVISGQDQGVFHRLRDGLTWEDIEGGKYVAAVKHARTLPEYHAMRRSQGRRY